MYGKFYCTEWWLCMTGFTVQRMAVCDEFYCIVGCPRMTSFTVFLIVFPKKRIGDVLDVYAVNYHSTIKCHIFVTC